MSASCWLLVYPELILIAYSSHSSINTTDRIYSILSEDDVKERIAGFGNLNSESGQKDHDEKLKRIMEILNE